MVCDQYSRGAGERGVPVIVARAAWSALPAAYSFYRVK